MNKKLLPVLCLGLMLTACGNMKKQEKKTEAAAQTEVAVSYAEEQAGVTEFYKAYLKGNLTQAEQDSLMDMCFIEPMQDKLVRMSEIVGADVLMRAQDYPADGAETLKVESLGEHWFMVSYLSDKNDPSSAVNIPVKTEMIDSQCKIIYITPEYNGQQYGDSLIDKAYLTRIGSREVSQMSAEAFVNGFYSVYASQYSDVDESLPKRLKTLRAEHLSDAALITFDKECAKRAMDIDSHHDWVINNSDFDPMWFESLRVTKVGNYRFMVFYNAGKIDYEMEVTVKRQDNKYMIDQIEAR